MAPQAHADSFNKTVAAGSKVRLAGYNTVNPDCTTRGYAVVRVMSAPSHGKITISKGVTYPSYAASSNYAACNKRKVPSMNVEYIPEKGFLGTDYLTMEAIFPSGYDRTDQFTVTTK